MHEVGELLGGRYLLERQLAAGGMGEVWCAQDRMLGRPVAVKLPRADGADPGYADRLLAEARHAAAVRHPGIAAVYDVSGDPPVPYLVLELVDGRPLSHLLHERGRLPPEQARDLLVQVADALAAAHAVGLVHRDVKPGNLLVSESGTVKVTDFGIARAADADTTTLPGFVVGTAPYLSPEQAAGASASPASDMYALGVVAFECLTGQRPFDGDPLAVLRAHREQPVPALADDVPADLRELVTALLDKDPARRPAAAHVARWATRDRNGPTAALPLGPAGLGPDLTAALPLLPAFAEPASPTADGPPARPQPSTATGPGTGRADPPVAGPPGLAAVSARLRRHPPLLVGAAAVVVALLLLALVTGRSRPAPGSAAPAGPGTPSAAAAGPLPVASASLFHPGGSADDHADEVPLAVDGNPATAWRTQTYASADFGRLRPGVGLMLDLGQVRTVREVRVQLATPGLTFSVRAGTAPGDGLLSAPLLGRVTAAPAAATVPAATPVPARYVVLWIERLPDNGPFQAGVQDVTVIG